MLKQFGDLEYYSIYEFVADYKEGYLSRRDMMRRVLHIAGGVASAASVLALLGCGGQAAPASAPAASSAAPKPASAAPASVSAVGSTAVSASAKPAASPAASGSAGAKPAASGSAAASAAPVAKSPLSVAANDPAIDGKDVTFQGNGATIMAYEARPKSAGGQLPIVLVVHENMGLVEHIRDVVRRWAKEGYLAVGVDLLSRDGGTPKVAAADASKIPGMLSTADAVNQAVGDFKAAADYYAKLPGVNPQRMGLNGFCFGGGVAWRSIEAISTLKAGAPWYGAPPPLDAVRDIKAAVLGVYSSDSNDFANKDRDQLDAALKAANVTHDFKVYPGTQHAFNNDTSPRYNQEQALVAWKDTQDWFAKYLKA